MNYRIMGEMARAVALRPVFYAVSRLINAPPWRSRTPSGFVLSRAAHPGCATFGRDPGL